MRTSRPNGGSSIKSPSQLAGSSARPTRVPRVRHTRVLLAAVAAAHIPLRHHRQNYRAGLLATNNGPRRIRRICLCLPRIQRHRIQASRQFGRITIRRRHSTLAYTKFSSQSFRTPSKRTGVHGCLVDGLGRLPFRIAVGVAGHPGAINGMPFV